MSAGNIVMGLGLAFSANLEHYLYRLRKHIRMLKSAPVLSEDSAVELNEEYHSYNPCCFITTQFHHRLNSITLSPYSYDYSILNSKKKITNEYLMEVINPRRFSIERIVPPFVFLIKLLCLLDTSVNSWKLIDHFNFFIGGDFITLFCSRNSLNYNLFNLSHSKRKPDIIIQGNKKDLIDHYKAKHKAVSRLRMISTIPLLIYYSEKLIHSFIKLTEWFSDMLKANGPAPVDHLKAKCSMCVERLAQVVFHACNHFNLCEKCFEQQGRKCTICNIVDSPHLIIT